VRASYAGDANFVASNASSLSQTVAVRPSSTTVTLAPTSVAVLIPSTVNVNVKDVAVTGPSGTPGAFVAASGLMTSARTGHTATLLPDGTVLVLDGTNSTGVLDSAAIYNPNTGSFTDLVIPANDPRTGHTATLLGDGTVLIVGGTSDGSASQALATAKVYDPIANSLTAVGGLTTERFKHTATLLADGKVLLAGGTNSSGTDLDSIEVYDPVAKTFAAAGNMSVARAGHAAALLSDGQHILITGGSGLDSAEVYDTASSSSAAIGNMNSQRTGHTASLLPDGTILIAGGTGSTDPLDSSELYDPTAGEFVTANGHLGMARTGHTATLLNDARVLVIGGADTTATVRNDAELYTPSFGPLGTVSVTSGNADDQISGSCVLALNGTGTTTCAASVTPQQVATNPHSITGSYPADSVHGSSSGNHDLTVTAGTPTITWANPSDITYSDPLGSTQLNATATYLGNAISGTFIYTPASGTVLTAGTHTLHVDFTPDNASDYIAQSADVTIVVQKKPASVRPNPASKTYGYTDPAFSGTLTGFLDADNVTATYSRIAGETVLGSPYKISATLSPAAVLDNYDIAYATADFAISPRNATWTTNPNSKTYGDPDPTPLTTGGGSNFVAGDGITATYARAVGKTAGGPYHITATLAPTAALSNYNITNAGADFTINKRDATWTTNSNSKPYGDLDPTPLTTGSGTNFIAADGITATYSRAAGETAGGPYQITATLAPTAALSNYNITNAGAAFTINKRNATWTTNPNSKTYGDPDPTPLTTGSGSNFVAADGISASYARALGETAGGPYHITATLTRTAALSNYNITNAGADFTISRRPASVTPNSSSKIYGDPDPSFTGVLAGFIAADNVTASYARATGEAVAGNPYVISATLSPTVVLSNYIVTYNTGNFTINKASLTVTAADKTMTLDASVPTLTGSITGIKFSDNITATYSTTATGTTVGSFPITATLVDPANKLPNYNVTNTPGTLKVQYVSSGICYGDAGHQALQPINADGSSVFKVGSVVPVKFRVCDAAGISISTPGVVKAFNLVGVYNGAASGVNELQYSNTPDTSFRWDSTAQQWIFNLSTKGTNSANFSAGTTYQFAIVLNDGSTIYFVIGAK
jgi:hypothetical protein